MNKLVREEYLARWKWIDPTKGYPDSTLIGGVERVTPIDETKHIAVSLGATHKALEYIEPIHSKDLERVDGLDWELFTAWYEGSINGVDYYWGMFVEGIGAINVMVVKAHTREITDTEREAWANKTLGMYGSHSGNLSYTMPSGVKR